MGSQPATVETPVEGTLRKGVDSFNYLGERSLQPWRYKMIQNLNLRKKIRISRKATCGVSFA
jgi:hypothetical protein